MALLSALLDNLGLLFEAVKLWFVRRSGRMVERQEQSKEALDRARRRIEGDNIIDLMSRDDIERLRNKWNK
jgi:hypothetical protein